MEEYEERSLGEYRAAFCYEEAECDSASVLVMNRQHDVTATSHPLPYGPRYPSSPFRSPVSPPRSTAMGASNPTTYRYDAEPYTAYDSAADYYPPPTASVPFENRFAVQTTPDQGYFLPASNSRASGSVASLSSHQTLAHPSALYPASPHSENPPTIFGVHADHHYLSHASKTPAAQASPGDRLPTFPNWSHTWYNGGHSANGHAYTAVRPPSGVSGWESETLSYPGQSPMGVYRGRDRNDEDAFVKKQRIKMLERKFGKPKIKHRNDDGTTQVGEDDNDSNGEESEPEEPLPPGSVTPRGTLVLVWRQTITIAAVLTVLFALAAVFCAVLAIIVVKIPSPGPIPGIKSHWTSYAVHAASLVAAIATTGIFVFRPCCCDAGRKAARQSGSPADGLGALGGAGMIIPIFSGQGGQPSSKGFFGRKKRLMQQQQAPPTVNLIVDPSLLAGGKRNEKHRPASSDYSSDEDSDDDADDDGWDALPGEYGRRPYRHTRRRRRKRGGRSSHPGFMARLQTQRIHNLALRSLMQGIAWISLVSLLCFAAICVAFAMSDGRATRCKAEGGSAASSWCTTWNTEIAMLCLYICSAWTWVTFATLAWRRGRKMRQEVARRAALP